MKWLQVKSNWALTELHGIQIKMNWIQMKRNWVLIDIDWSPQKTIGPQ